MRSESFGKHQLVRELGKGGMGTVYHARDITTSRDVAVKILHQTLADDESFRERFAREFRMLRSLNHPSIVKAFEFDEWGGEWFITMELMGGERLDQVLSRSKPLPAASCLKILAPIADALDHAHSKGIIHRDLKPSNIMIVAADTVKIMDFGVGFDSSQASMTIVGTQIGTPAYMSPEQRRGVKATKHSDLYSLGVIAYEMMTGVNPFSGSNPYAPVHPTPPPVRFNSGLNSQVQSVLVRMLSREPARRFRDARTFVKAIGAALAAPVDRRPQTAKGSQTTGPTRIRQRREAVAPPKRAVRTTENVKPSNQQRRQDRSDDTTRVTTRKPSPLPKKRRLVSRVKLMPQKWLPYAGLLVIICAVGILMHMVLSGSVGGGGTSTPPTPPPIRYQVRVKPADLNKAAAIQLVKEASLLFDKKDYEDALLKAKEAIKKDPGSVGARDMVTSCQSMLKEFQTAAAAALVKEASGLFNKKDYANALLKAREAIKKDPACVDAYDTMATCQYMLKHYQAAADASSEVLKIASSNSRSWVNLALAELALGHISRAKECAHRALELKPDDETQNLARVVLSKASG